MATEEAADVFQARLKEAREARGLNQQQLAEAAKLPPSSISHFESGSRKPSFDNLRRLAAALDVTTDYLLGRVDTRGSVGTAEKIYRHLSNMSKSDLELADNFLEMLARRNQQRHE
jgi:transcriptional regulator with XRE-family HTH domain